VCWTVQLGKWKTVVVVPDVFVAAVERLPAPPDIDASEVKEVDNLHLALLAGHKFHFLCSKKVNHHHCEISDDNKIKTIPIYRNSYRWGGGELLLGTTCVTKSGTSCNRGAE
jgi:hypothetical protein